MRNRANVITQPLALLPLRDQREHDSFHEEKVGLTFVLLCCSMQRFKSLSEEEKFSSVLKEDPERLFYFQLVSMHTHFRGAKTTALRCICRVLALENLVIAPNTSCAGENLSVDDIHTRTHTHTHTHTHKFNTLASFRWGVRTR